MDPSTSPDSVEVPVQWILIHTQAVPLSNPSCTVECIPSRDEATRPTEIPPLSLMATTVTCDKSGSNWPPGAETQCYDQTRINLTRNGTWSFDPASVMRLCANDACMSIVAAIRAANPTECVMNIVGTMLYDRFLNRLDAVCQTVSISSPGPTSAPPPATIPPVTTTTKKPQVTQVIERVESSGGSRNPETTATPPPSLPQATINNTTGRVNTTTLPSPTPNVTIVVDDPIVSSPVPVSSPPHSSYGHDAPKPQTISPSNPGESTRTTGTATSSSSHVGEIAGGLAAGMLVVVIVLMWLRRRHRQAEKPKRDTIIHNEIEDGETLTTLASGEFHTVVETQINELSQWFQPLEDWRVDETAIADVTLLGAGSQGVVYLVKLHDTRLLVAKRLVANTISRHRLRTFVDEIQLISGLQHPSIVSFIGVAWTTGYDVQALFEYMERGDLRSYLDRTEREPWTLQKVEIALQIVEALTFVHSFYPPIVHRDLKARNILLGNTMNAKISDFGVARIQSEDGTMTTGIGTSRWLAPEVIRGGGIYTEQCDIYSFGVVLVEMDTHAVPFAEVGGSMSEVMMLMRVADGDLRPELTEGCDPRIAEIVSQCLDVSPSKRPNALELAFRLRQIVKSLNDS